jgi:molybdate transport system substrate-binding protein
MYRFKSAMIGIAATLLGAAANAGELKVISAGAVRTVIGGMIDDYTRKSGQKITFTIGSTGQLRSIIASGEPADLVIVSAPLMAELEKTGKLMSGSRVDFGRIGLGVVIRDGAAVPNISTPEALKQLLIKAQSIAYTDPARGGTSYLHLMKISEQFGIAEVVTKKGAHATGGDDAVEKVAQGKAEIAVVLISEIHGTGVKLAAPLPEALQLWTVYSAAIPVSSTDAASARALVAALTRPAMRERWLAAGWQPVAR